MSINIEHILLELEDLPEYDTQLSLQVTADGSSGEGQLAKLDYKEEDFNVFAYDIPYTNSVLSELGMYRTRLMNMKPKTCYSYHWDPTKRMHIPLLTNENNFFVIDDEISRYPADGSYYLIDTTKKHTFVNASFENRLHIVGCVNE
jgi:hypothetical protein